MKESTTFNEVTVEENDDSKTFVVELSSDTTVKNDIAKKSKD